MESERKGRIFELEILQWVDIVLSHKILFWLGEGGEEEEIEKEERKRRICLWFERKCGLRVASSKVTQLIPYALLSLHLYFFFAFFEQSGGEKEKERKRERKPLEIPPSVQNGKTRIFTSVHLSVFCNRLSLPFLSFSFFLFFQRKREREARRRELLRRWSVKNNYPCNSLMFVCFFFFLFSLSP